MAVTLPAEVRYPASAFRSELGSSPRAQLLWCCPCEHLHTNAPAGSSVLLLCLSKFRVFPRCFPPMVRVIPVVSSCWKQLQDCENMAEWSSTHFSSSLGNFLTSVLSQTCIQCCVTKPARHKSREREGRSGDFSSQSGLRDCRAQSTPPRLFLYLNPWIPATIFLRAVFHFIRLHC